MRLLSSHNRVFTSVIPHANFFLFRIESYVEVRPELIYFRRFRTSNGLDAIQISLNNDVRIDILPTNFLEDTLLGSSRVLPVVCESIEVPPADAQIFYTIFNADKRGRIFS